jgi:hypothetical protein
MRHDDFVHNGGWYNLQGEKLGWGDLSLSDVVTLRDGLAPGEGFIILPESASFWKFVTHIGPIGSLSVTTPDIAAPGVDYMVEHAMYAIFPGQAYVIHWRGVPDNEPDYQARGRRSDGPTVTFRHLQRPQLREMLVASS